MCLCVCVRVCVFCVCVLCVRVCVLPVCLFCVYVCMSVREVFVFVAVLRTPCGQTLLVHVLAGPPCPRIHCSSAAIGGGGGDL